MRSLIIAGMALVLAGCATGAATVAPMDVERGISAAWSALGVAAVGIDEAVLDGKLKGEAAHTASVDLKAAKAALQAATTDLKSGDLTTAQGQISAATTLVSDLTAIVATAKGAT